METWNLKTFTGCYLRLNGSVFRLVSGDLLDEAFAEIADVDDFDAAELEAEGDDGSLDPEGKKPKEKVRDADDDSLARRNRLNIDEDLDDEESVSLDRPWPLASNPAIAIYRIALMPFYQYVLFQVGYYDSDIIIANNHPPRIHSSSPADDSCDPGIHPSAACHPRDRHGTA